jgi:flagellar M-ring protein FliF
MNFQAFFDKIREWWETSDRTQKLVSIFGAVFLVFLVAGTIWFSTRPQMEPIFPGASPADQGMVRDAIAALGFPVQINSKGDVLVATKDMPEIRMKLSQEGKIPASAMASVGGPTVPTEGGFFITPEEMQQRLKSMKEAELSKSIMTLEGVKSAIVHINFGKDSPFGDQKIPPSAVVNLTEDPGTGLAITEGKAIARLVQNSIPGLLPSNVSVVSSTGRMIYDGEELNSEDSAATRKLDAEKEESKRRERDIQRRLDAAFGEGTTLAVVQVELDMDEVERKEQSQLTGDTPITKESMVEEMQGAPTPPIGPSGTASNLPGQPAAAPTDGSTPGESYKTETEKAQYPTSLINTSTRKAAGEVVRMNINVLVDSNKVQDIPAVEDFLKGFLATAEERTFSAKVTPTPFSNAAQVAQQKMVESATNAQRIQQALSFLPIIALLGIGLMIVRAIGRQGPQPVPVVEAPQPAFAENEPMDALPAPEDSNSPEILGSPVLADQDPVYDLSELDSLTVDSILNPTNPDGTLSEGQEQNLKEFQNIMAAKGYDDEDDDDSITPIRGIKEKIDIPLEQIRKLAKERPETVAILLKSWIMEEN